MNALLRPRPWFLFVFVVCGGMLGFALYVQHYLFIDPCPLCVLQRLVYIWIAVVSLLAFLHNPGAVGRAIYGTAVILGGLTGGGIAGRHLWLQSLPADRVPDCGMGLNYMLDTMPFTDVLKEVFYGSGECAEVTWTFLGMSMPGWTFIWYMVFTIGTIFILVKGNSARV